MTLIYGYVSLTHMSIPAFVYSLLYLYYDSDGLIYVYEPQVCAVASMPYALDYFLTLFVYKP